MNIQSSEIDESVLKEYVSIINEWSGIYFSDLNISVLKMKILNIAKSKKLSAEEYLEKLKREEAETIHFIDAITTNFTKFFRHKEQFDFIKDELIPRLVLKRSQQGKYKLKLWSAGSSTGEEPYSLMITVFESFRENNMFMDFQIISSDISLKCIEMAQRGVYTVEKLSELNRNVIDRYMIQIEQNKYQIKNEYKKYIVFDFHNLMYDNGLREVDIIMCRNVIIYMDIESVKKVVQNLHTSLANDGYLFLSTTESLFGITKIFTISKRSEVYYYIKNSQAES